MKPSKYKYFRIIDSDLKHRIMNDNDNLSDHFIHSDVHADEILYIRHNTETDMLEAAFRTDRYFMDVSLDEEFLESLAPYEVERAEAQYASA